MGEKRARLRKGDGYKEEGDTGEKDKMNGGLGDDEGKQERR